MQGTPWRHTRVSLVGCCWCFSFWRGVFHLYLLAYFPLHIFWEICPLTLLVLSVSIHTFSCSEEAKIDSTAPSDKGVCFLLHLFTIREVPALRREWVYCILNKWMKTTRHLFEKCTQCIHEANGCTLFDGGNGTLLNACNKSCKKKKKHIIEPKIAVKTYLPVQQALAESGENTDMSLNHHTWPCHTKTSKMKIKYCPWYISILSNTSKFLRIAVLFIQVIPSSYFWTTIKHWCYF